MSWLSECLYFENPGWSWIVVVFSPHQVDVTFFLDNVAPRVLPIA